MIRCPPSPLHGVPRCEFPRFAGTVQALRLPLIHPSRLLPLARRYHRFILGIGHPAPSRRVLGGDEGTSQVPGHPHAYMPCSQTPVRLGTRSLRCVDAAFRQSHDVGSHVSVSLRGSITRPARFLCTLHVRGCPRPRNTRFRLLTTLCRVGLDAHWVATKGFRVSFPPSQALPGARDLETRPHPRLVRVDSRLPRRATAHSRGKSDGAASAAVTGARVRTNENSDPGGDRS